MESLAFFPAQRRLLVFTPYNRRDADVVAMGRIIGDGFDRVYLPREEGNRDRAEDELPSLLSRGIASSKRKSETVEVGSELAAIEAALHDLQTGDLLVLGVEATEESLTLVKAHLPSAVPLAATPT